MYHFKVIDLKINNPEGKLNGLLLSHITIAIMIINK
jgi:hypothetical protein